MTIIVAISDSHGQHRKLKLPKGDILIHAGDWSSYGKWEDTVDFLYWFSSQDFKYKILIAGNHDWIPYLDPSGFRKELRKTNIIYLEDESIDIKGIKFYGTPWTPEFNGWAFNSDINHLKYRANKIPEDIDVLISHGPPLGILDTIYYANGSFKENCGDVSLLYRIKNINLKFHLFGHIHNEYGQVHNRISSFYNLSVLDDFYKLVNKPTIIDI